MQSEHALSSPVGTASPSALARNVFLIGMMGAGKSTLGRALAKRLGCGFVDADQELTSRTGVSIATIFEIEGEAGFRDREQALIAELAERRGIVLATGGGAVLRPENRRLLREHGLVIYLHAPLAELWRRVRHDKSRPLLNTTDPLATLRTLYEARDPIYREVAHVTLDSGGHRPHALVEEIARLAGEPAREP